MVLCEATHSILSSFFPLDVMDKSEFIKSLASGASLFGVSLDDESLSLFFRYYELLIDWNTRMNLISNRDLDRFVSYHLLDSLKIVTCADFSRISRLLDFGSGAGLPGIPLAISFPHISFTLVDSIEKRIRFLEETVCSLSLDNVTVLRSRAETLPASLNLSFDAVVTRATVSLSLFFSLCSRFIKRDGCLISIKGEDVSDELSSLKRTVKSLVFNIRDCIPVVPDSVRAGHIIIISSG